MARAAWGPWPSLTLLPWPGEGLSTGLQSQQEAVSIAHDVGKGVRPQSLLSPSHGPSAPLLPEGQLAWKVWQQPSWVADGRPAGVGKAEEALGYRTWAVAPGLGSWRRAADGTKGMSVLGQQMLCILGGKPHPGTHW